MGCTLSIEEDAGILDEKERARELSFTAPSSESSGEVNAEDGIEAATASVRNVEPVLVMDEGEQNSQGGSKGSSSASSSFDNLKIVVGNMKHDVDNRCKQHMQPTEAQLKDFVTRICAVLKNLAGNAPTSIKRAVASSFSLCGYEFVSGVIVSPSKFTLHYLAESLKFLVSQLKTWSPSPTPTAEEAGSIKLAAARLWELDGNRLERGIDYELNIQCEKNPNNHADVAAENLFSYIDQDVLERPTYKAFRSLLDNYVATLGYSDSYTQTEREEMNTFINTISETQCMQYCHAWLVKNKKAPGNYVRFMKQVHAAWFTLYRRKVENDSSGFEHVFLGERDEQKKTVSGLHNWIQIAEEERQGALDYKGRIKSKRGSSSSDLSFITIQFEWQKQEKFLSSTLIGTSPEFEIALLSMCFFNGKESTTVSCGPHELAIKCYAIRRNGKKYIGSAYPEEI